MTAFPPHWPVVGICGFSGSGKTTLIEALVPRYTVRGLAVAVVKHDAHGLAMDRPGKDSDRFFAAGATVVVHDPRQSVRRSHKSATGEILAGAAAELLRDHDLVLVEGHKQTPLPLRLWLPGEDGAPPPEDAGEFAAVLSRDGSRPDRAAALIDARLRACQEARPLAAGLLVGGRSRRMGRPKSLLRSGGRTWAEAAHDAVASHVRDVVLLGDGPVPGSLAHLPRLVDVPDHVGPLAGMVAAMRWRPDAAWVFAACDMPLLDGEAIAWLLTQRSPGTWAVLPRQVGETRAEPLCAWYDPRLRPILEECDRPQAVAGHRRVRVVDLPGELAPRWLGFNAPDQLAGRIELEDSDGREVREKGLLEDGR